MEPRWLYQEPSPNKCLFAPRLAAARAILLLLALLLVSGPFTERFCGWDHFLSTGRDFEFTVLGVLLFCGLTLLAACKTSPWRSALSLLRGFLRLEAQRVLLRCTGPALLHQPGSGIAAPPQFVLMLRI